MLSLQLGDGRRLELKACYQQHTYLSLMSGQPRERINQQIIAGLADHARNNIFRTYNEPPVHVLEPAVPVETDANEPPELLKLLGRRATLPLIVCVGLFQSGPARDLTRHFSLLVLIWFQDSPRLIEESALNAIRAVNWTALAQDRTQ